MFGLLNGLCNKIYLRASLYILSIKLTCGSENQYFEQRVAHYCSLSTRRHLHHLSLPVVMTSFVPLLVTLAALFSASMTFENVKALPIYSTHEARNVLTYKTRDLFNFAQIKQSRKFVIDSLKNYTDREMFQESLQFLTISQNLSSFKLWA